MATFKVTDIPNDFIDRLHDRFKNAGIELNGLNWEEVKDRVKNSVVGLSTLYKMELSGGEPCLVDQDNTGGKLVFIDSAKESPIGRRSYCYDRAALNARKANKPNDSAMDVAHEIGIQLLTESEYRKYHPLFLFDAKTSSWIWTPDDVRNLGGALFCDYRFGKVFTYHNGAESYYSGRGFRGIVSI